MKYPALAVGHIPLRMFLFEAELFLAQAPDSVRHNNDDRKGESCEREKD
jgi:hypothetical protein